MSESTPGPVLFQEGVLGVESSAVELQRGETSVVQRDRLLRCGRVLPWRIRKAIRWKRFRQKLKLKAVQSLVWGGS